ncbi:hypothetical protein K439DRAFT_785263 [Ramaria rubella]|nr:hypothetical protein K439DRAFT_785263 [Ramaria rubella]
MSTAQSHETPHFNTIYALLPPVLKAGIDDLLSRATRESAARHTLDQLVRFSLSRDASDGDPDSREEWNTQSQKVEKALADLSSGKGKKRVREDVPGTGSSDAANDPKVKKAKVDSGSGDSSEDEPLYTLHAISASSPVRKKVDITVHRNSIRFKHATSGAQEASISLTSLSRAFLISTPGKSKPYWTVIILTDVEQNQIIFGLDASPPSLSTTEHPVAPRILHGKGTEAKPSLLKFLSHLPPRVVLQEPSIAQFRSAGGEPFLDAYLRAKDGHLLFFKDGILFGEKKPCIWIGMGEIDSVRSLSATGRTFSLFVRRVATAEDEANEVEGEETEFSLIDGKNQDAVARWVQDNQRRFGVSTNVTVTRNDVEMDELAGDEEIHERKKGEDEEDLDDDDYESESESDGGSASSESSEEGGGEEEGNETQSGSGEDEDGEDEGEEELDESNHPLLRPGAMPKISKAALNAVVGMMEQDLMGSSSKIAQEAEQNEDVDELED